MKTHVPVTAEDLAVHADAGVEARPWVYLVLVLTIVYILNFVDRQIFNILAEPIKKELGLHDWQLGAMTGLSFALIYGVMAIPVARLAERVNRPRLISAALALWSGATMMCAAASSFIPLAAARLVVGLGESGYAPASYSLMAESVPKARRTFAFAIFSTAIPLGAMLALGAGGIIADLWGWRASLLLAGIPGLIMTLVILATIKEPRNAAGAIPRGESSFGDDARILLRKPTFRLFCVGGGLMGMSFYGVQAFIASFLIRNHVSGIAALADTFNASHGTHLGAMAVIGPALGLILGLTGIVAALVSGAVNDKLVARDAKYYAFMAGIPQILSVPALAAGLYWTSMSGALIAIATYFLFAGMTAPVWTACIQGLAGPTRRATAAAISLLALIMMGNGLGPFSIGLMSDLATSMGLSSGAALRVALLIGVSPALVGGGVFLLAARHLKNDLVDI